MLCDSLCWKYGMLTLSVGWWLPCISVPFYLNYYLKVTRQTKKDYLKEKEFVWTENAANSICKSMLGRKHAFCFVAFTSEHCSTARASWVHLITRTLPVCAFFFVIFTKSFWVKQCCLISYFEYQGFLHHCSFGIVIRYPNCAVLNSTLPYLKDQGGFVELDVSQHWLISALISTDVWFVIQFQVLSIPPTNNACRKYKMYKILNMSVRPCTSDSLNQLLNVLFCIVIVVAEPSKNYGLHTIRSLLQIMQAV